MDYRRLGEACCLQPQRKRIEVGDFEHRPVGKADKSWRVPHGFGNLDVGAARPPFAELAGHVLYAQSTHPVLPSSAAAALAVIEALTVALMVSNKDNVAKAARLTEVISAYLYRADDGKSVKGITSTSKTKNK